MEFQLVQKQIDHCKYHYTIILRLQKLHLWIFFPFYNYIENDLFFIKTIKLFFDGMKLLQKLILKLRIRTLKKTNIDFTFLQRYVAVDN